MVSCPGFPGPSEENSGSLAQILFYSSLFNFIHVYSGLFKFIQAHSSLLKVQGLAPCSLGYWSLCYWLTSWSRPITPPLFFLSFLLSWNIQRCWICVVISEATPCFIWLVAPTYLVASLPLDACWRFFLSRHVPFGDTLDIALLSNTY